MTIELSADIESQLRELAASEGRDVTTLVDEAIKHYVEIRSITDLSSADIAEGQMAMLREMPPMPDWDERPE